MRAKHVVSIFLATTAAFVLAAFPARADAIDGDWCNATRHLTIKGPDIVTPGGARLKGDYDRHAFTYVVPAKESGAGQTINMILVDDDTVYLRAGEKPGFGPGEAEVWRRCSIHTS